MRTFDPPAPRQLHMYPLVDWSAYVAVRAIGSGVLGKGDIVKSCVW